MATLHVDGCNLSLCVRYVMQPLNKRRDLTLLRLHWLQINVCELADALAARMAAERQPNESSDNAHGNGRAVAWYEATAKRQRSDTKRHHSRCSFSLYSPGWVIRTHGV